MSAGKKSFRWKRWLLPLTILAIVCALAAPSLWQVIKLIGFVEIYANRSHVRVRQPLNGLFVKLDLWNVSRLSVGERLILLGDEDAPTEELRLKAIVDRFPDRPDFYAEYAEQCLRSLKNLPDDFETTVARIDPDNGYFFFLKAVEADQDSATVSYDGTARRHIYKTHAERQQQSDHWRRRSINAEIFRSYRKELNIHRIKGLPPREDLLTSLFVMIYQPLPSDVASALKEHSRSVIREIDTLGGTGQEARFRALLEDYQTLEHRFIGYGPTSEYSLDGDADIKEKLNTVARSAKKLGIEPENSHFIQLGEWVKKNPSIYFRLITSTSSSPAVEQMMERASSLHQNFRHYSSVIPDDSIPSNEALTPGRLAEHALWGRVASLLMVALLAVLAWLLQLYRFRHGQLPRLVTYSLKRTLRPVDYLWVVLLGVGAPLLWHQAVRQSPWGGLDFNLVLRFEKLIVPQWIALTFMVLMTTTIACRWRVKRRLRGLDLGIARSPFTWICLLLTAATMPLMQYWIENPALPDETMLSAAAVPAIWFIVSLTRSLFLPAKSIFGQLLVSRVMALSWLLACVVFAVCAPVYYEIERYWVARDTLLQNPDFPNALEKKIVAEINRENLELLDRMKVER